MASIEDRPVSNSLVNHVRGLIAAPRAEWTRIDLEPATRRSLMTGYACILAAIGPIAQFVGSLVFGYQALWMRYHPTIMGAVAVAIANYVLALATVFILGLIIDGMAPWFGGERGRTQGLKVAVYSATPGWLAGIVLIIPQLGILVFAATLYGLFLMYLGLPRVMKNPPGKTLGYWGLTVIAACLIYIVTLLVTGSIMDSFSGGVFTAPAGSAAAG